MSPRHRIGQHLHERPIAGPSRARQAPQDLNDIGIIDLTLSSDDEDIVPLRLNRRKLSEWRVDSESLSDQGFLPTPQRRFQYHIDIDEEVPDQPPVFNPPPPKPPQPELAPLPDGSLDPLAPDAAPADDPAEPVNPLARVLELVPDVDVNHAQQLLNEFLTAAGMDAAIENTLNRLFEDPSYPKAEKAKKRKRDEFEEQPRPQAPSKVPRIDYASTNRLFEGGLKYHEQAMEILQIHFPRVPKPDVRRFLARHGNHLAPTYLFLEAEDAKPPHARVYVEKKTTYKKKHVQIDDEVLERELNWVQTRGDEQAVGEEAPIDDVAGPSQDQGKGKAKEVPQEESLECDEADGGVECGCCFSSFVFDTLVQCPDAHLFCIACVRFYVEQKLGDGLATFKCMSSSEPACEASFSEAVLSRIIKSKTMELYHRVCARRDLQAAGLDGLEECPFCDYACVVENAEEKLFRCQREDCGEISCRKCKKRDHVPKSCKEAANDNHLDAQHTVEEEMTNALLRKCPNQQCQKPFIKEFGCNKIVCQHCGTLSCYICRERIAGYEHFNQMPGGARRPPSVKAGKCPLFDDQGNPEARHQVEIAAARERAMAEVAAQNPEVDATKIKVDMPSPPKIRAPPHVHMPAFGIPLILGGHPFPPGFPPQYLQPVPRAPAMHQLVQERLQRLHQLRNDLANQPALVIQEGLPAAQMPILPYAANYGQLQHQQGLPYPVQEPAPQQHAPARRR